MKKYVLFSAILISILFLSNSAIAQITPYMGYWRPQVQFPLFPLAASNFALGYPTPYLSPLMPPLPFPSGMPYFQPSLPFLMAPQISAPSPVLRMAAATITIFSAPTLSAIQVTALPVVPIPLTATSTTTSTTAYTYILPALLTIPTTPYTQTLTASITSIFPLAPLIGTSTAIFPGLLGLTPTI